MKRQGGELIREKMNPRQKFYLFFGVKLERGGDFDICQITFAFEDDITILSWIKRK